MTKSRVRSTDDQTRPKGKAVGSNPTRETIKYDYFWYLDKSFWSDGEWSREADFCEFTHKGLICVAGRAYTGNLCGYVSIKKTHSAYGKSYGHELFDDLEIHGGLTYSDAELVFEKYSSFMDKNTKYWWLGFDCAHIGDAMPYRITVNTQNDSYKNMSYVIKECKNLANYLSKLK